MASTTSDSTKHSSLTSSRHNPDFMDRTLTKRLKIEDRLSAFRRLVNALVQKGDEEGFEECYARAEKLIVDGDARRMAGGGGTGIGYGVRTPASTCSGGDGSSVGGKVGLAVKREKLKESDEEKKERMAERQSFFYEG